MTDQLTQLADRLLQLMQDHPDGIPSYLLGIEHRRVVELAHMVEQGLTD